MPDIISRIKIEAQGADQAAREIQKLTEAYKNAGAAAKGMSATGIGESDPFLRAVAPPGGQTPADVETREERSRHERAAQRDRERQNSSYNSALRPGMVNQGLSSVEAAATGRGGAAVGGVLSGAAPFLGPAGIGVAALAAAAMGIQRMADSAYGRMEEIYGAGVSQRLGRSYADIQNVQTGYARKGIPVGMVRSFFASGSQSGLNMNDPSALAATGTMMEAMAQLGLDPGAAAGVMGAMSRSQVGFGSIGGNRGYEFIGQAVQSFGRENLTTYMKQMAQNIEVMATRGIDITEESIMAQSSLMTDLARYGGMAPEGAVAMTQRTLERGRQAAQLQRPEDIVAFQAMRSANPNMSATDVMIAMEQRPDKVNAQVYEYLRGATGGDIETLRTRLHSYLGGDMSAVADFITTMEVRAGRQAAPEGWARDTTRWQGMIRDGSGKLEYADPARKTVMVRQSEMLRGIEEAMLDLTTGVMGAFRSMFQGEPDMNPWSMTWAGYKVGTKPIPGEPLPMPPINTPEVIINAGIARMDAAIEGAGLTDRFSMLANIAGEPASTYQASLYYGAIPGMTEERGWFAAASDMAQNIQTRMYEAARAEGRDVVKPSHSVRSQFINEETVKSQQDVTDQLFRLINFLIDQANYVVTDEMIEGRSK